MNRFDVTLAGEANLDLLFYGLPDDLPADREFIANSMALTLGGSPAITAHNLAALGSRTGFITFDQLNELCAREFGPLDIEALMAALGERDSSHRSRGRRRRNHHVRSAERLSGKSCN